MVHCSCAQHKRAVCDAATNPQAAALIHTHRVPAMQRLRAAAPGQPLSPGRSAVYHRPLLGSGLPGLWAGCLLTSGLLENEPGYLSQPGNAQQPPSGVWRGMHQGQVFNMQFYVPMSDLFLPISAELTEQLERIFACYCTSSKYVIWQTVG